jgi:hypothetical protein
LAPTLKIHCLACASTYKDGLGRSNVARGVRGDGFRVIFQ